MMTLDHYVDLILLPVDEPGSRLFYWNALSSLFLIFIWLAFFSYSGWQKHPGSRPKIKVRPYFRDLIRKASRLVLNKKYWWNPSTRIDYALYFFNGALKVFLFVPLLDISFGIAESVSWTLYKVFAKSPDLELTKVAMLGMSIAAFVWDDFLRFGHHRLMHRIPWLWRLHRVHHSATVLTPITLFRVHPLESALAVLRNSLSLGVMTGLFIYLFSARFTVLTVFGINMFGFLFNFLGANLRHSHIAFSFGPWLENFFISPAQHQLHHLQHPTLQRNNFGVSLAIWDLWQGSLMRVTDFYAWKSCKQRPRQTGPPLRFGLNSDAF